MIIGHSPAIRRAQALVERYAPTRLSILLVGPTGTGKELFAREIHRLSGRGGPLVDVNCFVLPRDMVDSLLFGHARGAFTGAVVSTMGHIERSGGGTLFLDELSSLAPEAQGKLLRVLETGEVQRLGAQLRQRVDLRVVGAVQEGIVGDIEAGRFRHDLYQRVAGVVIDLPPLRQRQEDVVSLAQYFAGLQGQRLEVAAERVLLDYAWPGNVRELRFAIERAGRLVENGSLPPTAVAEAIALGGLVRQGESRLAAEPDRERAELLRLCAECSWDYERIARALGVTRTTLYRRLRNVGVSFRETKRLHVVAECCAAIRIKSRQAEPPTALSTHTSTRRR